MAAMARMLADCPCCGQAVWIIVSTKLFELNDPTLREDPWGSQVLVPAASAAESSSDGSEGATGATAQAATATGKGEGGHVPAVPGGGGKRNSKGGGHEHEQEHPREATPPPRRSSGSGPATDLGQPEVDHKARHVESHCIALPAGLRGLLWS